MSRLRKKAGERIVYLDRQCNESDPNASNHCGHASCTSATFGRPSRYTSWAVAAALGRSKTGHTQISERRRRRRRRRRWSQLKGPRPAEWPCGHVCARTLELVLASFGEQSCAVQSAECAGSVGRAPRLAQVTTNRYRSAARVGQTQFPMGPVGSKDLSKLASLGSHFAEKLLEPRGQNRPCAKRGALRLFYSH